MPTYNFHPYEASPRVMASENVEKILDVLMRARLEGAVVTLGGDGTLLDAIHQHGTGRRYFPLNYGTRGYLTNRRMTPDEIVEKNKHHGVKWVKMPMLWMHGMDEKLCAFNEFYIHNAAGQAAKLLVKVNGNPVTEEPVICSGITICTPQGSTGFASTTGASCLTPDIEAMGVVFVNPYHPRPAPMVIGLDNNIEVEMVDAEHRPCRVNFDGRSKVLTTNKVIINRCPTPVEVGYTHDHNFTRRMIAKVIR